MNNIIVYSTHCPRCKILEQCLTSIGAEYVVEDDKDVIIGLGIETVPCMVINNGEPMDFKQAMNWVKERMNG